MFGKQNMHMNAVVLQLISLISDSKDMGKWYNFPYLYSPCLPHPSAIKYKQQTVLSTLKRESPYNDNAKYVIFFALLATILFHW